MTLYYGICSTNLAVSFWATCHALSSIDALGEARAPLEGGLHELERSVRGGASSKVGSVSAKMEAVC